MSDPNVNEAPPAPQAEELPDPLKGKSPQEVYQMLREEHNRVIGEMQAAPKVPVSPVQASQPAMVSPVQPPQPPSVVPDPATLYSDPDRFIGEQFDRRMAPIVNTFVQAQRETNKNMLMQKVGAEEYTKYQGEIEQVMNGLDPKLQANPNSYVVAYNYVRAAHIDNIVKERAEKQAEEMAQRVLQRMGVDPTTVPQEQKPQPRVSLFGGGGVPQTATPRAVQQAPVVRFSEAERRVMKAMDLTEAEYVEYKKFNNDAITQMGRR